MLYLYDRALVKDLKESFNPENVENPVVKVIDPEGVIGLAAQIQNDEIKFPIVALERDQDTPIDQDRWNFTRAHKGVVSVFDNKTNQLYYEKAVPIKLSYELTLLTTNTADMDELFREILMKYISMYFLKIKLPYECERYVRFGVTIDYDNIQRSSGSFDYIEGGKLYQTIVPLRCEGCVLVTYTPVKLKRSEVQIQPINNVN